MKFHLGLTANMALMLALWSITVTASPIMSVVDRLADHDAPGAPMVAAFMRELELERTNQQTWEKDLRDALTAYKNNDLYLGNTNLATAGKDVTDELVCVKHGDLIKYLGVVEGKYDQATAALKAKRALLAAIDELLENTENVNQGLHCGNNKSEGAVALCNLLAKLKSDATEEEDLLDEDKAEIEAHKKDVNDYTCDCTFGDWDEFSECSGDSVQTVTTYKNCGVNEASCEINKDAKCGSGTKYTTRTLKWAAKGGNECESGDYTVGGDQGDLSMVGEDRQKFTTDCKAGDNEGECPVHCAWGEWTGSFEDQICEVGESCMDGDGNRANAIRSIYRKENPKNQYDGKPCFATDDGLTNQKDETCYFENKVAFDKSALEELKGKFETEATKLKDEMCKNKVGPCQNGGACKVEYESEAVTKWCTCPDTHTGDWCEKDLTPPECNGYNTLDDGKREKEFAGKESDEIYVDARSTDGGRIISTDWKGSFAETGKYYRFLKTMFFSRMAAGYDEEYFKFEKSDKRCGTEQPGYIEDSNVHDDIDIGKRKTDVKVCFANSQSRCIDSVFINITRCPTAGPWGGQGFFVYQLPDAACNSRYCGDY